MTTTDILDAINASIDHGQIADAIRSQVSSPTGAPSPDAWLSAEILEALGTLDNKDADMLINQLYVIAGAYALVAHG